MAPQTFDLSRVLEHALLTRGLLAPTIYRLAERRKDREEGCRQIAVTFRRSVRGQPEEFIVCIRWSAALLALHHGYSQVLEDLAKLGRTKNDAVITELAALGLAFALVMVLLPEDRITRVVPRGDRGDFYLNGRRDEMIEIAGTVSRDLNRLFNEKKTQVLLNTSLTKALVNVSRFGMPASRLERVK